MGAVVGVLHQLLVINLGKSGENSSFTLLRRHRVSVSNISDCGPKADMSFELASVLVLTPVYNVTCHWSFKLSVLRPTCLKRRCRPEMTLGATWHRSTPRVNKSNCLDLHFKTLLF